MHASLTRMVRPSRAISCACGCETMRWAGRCQTLCACPGIPPMESPLTASSTGATPWSPCLSIWSRGITTPRLLSCRMTKKTTKMTRARRLLVKVPLTLKLPLPFLLLHQQSPPLLLQWTATQVLRPQSWKTLSNKRPLLPPSLTFTDLLTFSLGLGVLAPIFVSYWFLIFYRLF